MAEGYSRLKISVSWLHSVGFRWMNDSYLYSSSSKAKATHRPLFLYPSSTILSIGVPNLSKLPVS